MNGKNKTVTPSRGVPSERWPTSRLMKSNRPDSRHNNNRWAPQKRTSLQEFCAAFTWHTEFALRTQREFAVILAPREVAVGTPDRKRR